MMALVPLINNMCESDEERRTMLDYLLTSANELDGIIKEITDKSQIEDFQNIIKGNG